jgi:hypothetical protein
MQKGGEIMGHECGGHHGGWHGRGHHGGHRHGGRCGCGQHHGFRRRFWTKEERIAWLEHYLENLQAEAQAVEEKLAKMKKEG